jgi:hypothetical protein
MAMGNVNLETVQYSSLNDIDDIEPISDADEAVLADVRDVLRKHQVTDRFGLCLLHRHFDLGVDEVIVESTDIGARVSTLVVEPKTSITGRAIETMWKFSKDGELAAITECRQKCHYASGHKSVHVKVGR